MKTFRQFCEKRRIDTHLLNIALTNVIHQIVGLDTPLKVELEVEPGDRRGSERID